MDYYIFNEDCKVTMQRMVDNEQLWGGVNTILTSPPYNMTKRPGGYADKQKRYDVYQDWKTEDEYIGWIVEIFNMFDGILKENGNILFNLSYSIENPMLPYKVVSNIHQNTPFTVVDTIVWKKNNCILFPANKNRLCRICEFIFVICRKDEANTFVTNRKVTRIGTNGQSYYEPSMNFIEARNNDGACKLNKATYSSELCEKLLNVYTPQGSVVYDPFNGTGTTGVACVRNKMGKYIGSEISKEQCDYSNIRLQNAINEMYDEHQLSFA